MSEPLQPPPWLTAMVDQVHATVRTNKEDNLAAAAESRCAAPLAGGCGKKIDDPINDFRDPASQAEYAITRLCQDCQDKLFMPPAEEMYEDLENFGRCHICGLWRDYVHLDVEVGVIKGFDCCPYKRPPVPWPGKCEKEEGCLLGAGHRLNCEHNKEAVY